MTLDSTTWLCGGPPAVGQMQRYPGRFMSNLKKTYPELVNDKCLHVFSGSCEFGIGVDFRVESNADVVCDYANLPFKNSSLFAGLADPPYADHWQNQWHGLLPRPKGILKELVRVVRPNGLIGILHIIVIPAYKEFGVTRIGLHPVLCGPNNAIRVFNVFRNTRIAKELR